MGLQQPYALTLSDEERTGLPLFINKVDAGARQLKRAHMRKN
jgi:hypothetical protein